MLPSSANRSHLETGPSALLLHRRPPRRLEGVEPAVWLVNRGKATPLPLPLHHGRIFGGEGRRQRFARSPGGRGRHRGGGITLPLLPPVAPSTEGGDTGVLRSQQEVVTPTPAPPPPTAASPAVDVLSDTVFQEWLESDRLDLPAQQENPRSQPRRHTVTSAVTRSAALTQLGVGDQPGRPRFYPRRRISVRRLPPRPRPIPTAPSILDPRPAIWRRRTRTRRRTRDLIARFGGQRKTRSSATCARLAHSRSWGAHSNGGSTLFWPCGCILGRVTSLAM